MAENLFFDQVLSQTDEHRQRVLSSAANNLRVWFIKVRKLKAIYHTLNLFNLDVTQKCLIAECWCPVSDLEQIQIALRRGTVSIILIIVMSYNLGLLLFFWNFLKVLIKMSLAYLL